MSTKLSIFVVMIFLTNLSFADPFDAFKEIAKELDKSVKQNQENQKQNSSQQENLKKNNEEKLQVSNNSNLFEIFTRNNKTQSVRWENLEKCNFGVRGEKPGIRFFNKNNQFHDLDEKGYAFQYYSGNDANPKYYGNIKNITQDPKTKLITTEEIIKFSNQPELIYISKNIYKIDDYKMQIMYMDMTSDNGKKVYIENGIDRDTKKEEIKYDCSAPETIALLDNMDKSKKIAEEKSKNSPEGKAKSLIEFYEYYLFVSDCYEIRKPYAVPYITSEVYADVKRNMKKIEANIKQTTPSLDTSKLWEKATLSYQNSDMGKTMTLIKASPNNYNKDIQTRCNLGVFVINEEVPKEAPKKNF